RSDQLADPSITAGELTQQTPPQLFTREIEKRGRARRSPVGAHARKLHQPGLIDQPWPASTGESVTGRPTRGRRARAVQIAVRAANVCWSHLVRGCVSKRSMSRCRAEARCPLEPPVWC